MGPIDYLVQHMMIPFLTFSYGTIYPNYGVAIILLTLLVKVVFYPLTHKQFSSMEQMKKIQPKLKEIQEKFKKQPDKLQKEMMNLYKENKVNPFAGCLPMLLQLPFFFAIFYTVNSEVFKALLVEPGVNPGLFSFWLANLATPDTTYILPIVIGVSTYWSQKLMVTDQNQMKFMAFMPIFMVVICLKMPAGVLLYWAASQIISTIQQVMIMKKISS